MKKLFGIMVCCLFGLMLCVSNAQAYGVYLEPRVALELSQSDYTKGSSGGHRLLKDNNISGGLAIGYDFHTRMNVPVRVEAEFMIANNMQFDFKGKNFTVPTPKSFFANAYLDYHNSTNFIPYMGGGVGTSILKNETAFSWNLGAGVAYKFNDNWKAVLGYRHIKYGKYFTNQYSGKLSSNEVMLGVRYTF